MTMETRGAGWADMACHGGVQGLAPPGAAVPLHRIAFRCLRALWTGCGSFRHLPIRTPSCLRDHQGLPATQRHRRVHRAAGREAPRLRRRVDATLREALVDDEWDLGGTVLEVSGTPGERVRQVLARLAVAFPRKL